MLEMYFALKREEGIAYSSEVYLNGAFSFKQFEQTYLSSKGHDLSKSWMKKSIGSYWKNIWNSINVFHYGDKFASVYYFKYRHYFRLEDEHWSGFMNGYSLKVSCKEIATEYNTVLKLRGFNCPLTCNEKSLNSNEIPVGFKLPDFLQ